MKLYLIRHAESYGNIKGKIISTTDFELTEKGISQSQRIGQKICLELKQAPISAYCSPLARARQTLVEILRSTSQENIPFTETPFLKEMDLGLLEGMTWKNDGRNIRKWIWIKNCPCSRLPAGNLIRM